MKTRNLLCYLILPVLILLAFAGSASGQSFLHVNVHCGYPAAQQPLLEEAVVMLTGPDGTNTYQFGGSTTFDMTGLSAGNYKVSVYADANPLNGITTYDMVLILRHLTGVAPFTQAWQWVAADVNQDGMVTVSDIVELRRLILGIYAELPDNQSWRFIAPGFVLSPVFPLSDIIPDTYDFNWDPNNPVLPVLDFASVKVGNLSPESNGCASSLKVQSRVLNAGESTILCIRPEDAGLWSALQFDLKFNPDAVSVEPFGLTEATEFKVNAASSHLRYSWCNVYGNEFEAGVPILKFKVKARKDIDLSTGIELERSGLVTCAFDDQGRQQELKLQLTEEMGALESAVVRMP